MNGKLQILYVGPLQQGSTSLQRINALQGLDHKVLPINTCPPNVARKQKCLIYRIAREIIGPLDLVQANKQILSYAKCQDIDVLWLDKALSIKRSTIQRLKRINSNCSIVGYSPDDMCGNKNNQSKRFWKHISEYDIYFTTKSFLVDEMQKMGCKRVEFIDNAYDSETHKPMQLAEKDKKQMGGPVGFIGSWEHERAQSLFFLAKNDFQVRVWGDGWKKCKIKHPNLRIEYKSIWGSDYARVICSFDINLCFLRKANRDLQTTRSVEIPACGGFMLAERSTEHLELFEEGKEAAFFSSDEELLEKLKYYLSHPQVCRRIATAGRERCVKSGYSNQDRLKEMLEKIEGIGN